MLLLILKLVVVPFVPALSLQSSFSSRRALLRRLGTSSTAGVSPFLLSPSLPRPAFADLPGAAASGVPLLGRFEPLTGAKSFIGSWRYEGRGRGPEIGKLVFLKNGEVEFRSLEEEKEDSLSTVLGVGAVPWKYVSPKGGDTIVTVTFTLDVDGEDDVLIFQASLDSAGGPQRVMEGSIETGRAEIGARGGGPRKRVGSFKAQFIEQM